MAKGGKDVDIVTELENLQSFTHFLTSKPGLVVCDCFQDWAGPCVVMKRFLKKAKFEFLDGEDLDLVNYCSIRVEAVPAFKNLRGHCIPTYLFFGGKKLVHIFRGYQPSLLMPLIKEMVTREKLCMAGKAKRHVLSDVVPYVIPEEDPPLPELEILASPVTPSVDDETALLEEPPVTDVDENASVKDVQPVSASEEALVTLAAHTKRSHYPEGPAEETTKRDTVTNPSEVPLAPVAVAEAVEQQNAATTAAQLAVGVLTSKHFRVCYSHKSTTYTSTIGKSEVPAPQTEPAAVTTADLPTVHASDPMTQVPGINQQEPTPETQTAPESALPDPIEHTPAPMPGTEVRPPDKDAVPTNEELPVSEEAKGTVASAVEGGTELGEKLAPVE